MVYNYKPDAPLTDMDLEIIGKKSARVDIPLLSRGGITDAVELLSELQGDLLRAGKAKISERLALLEARMLIEQTNQKMKMLRSREETTLNDRRDLAKKVVQMGNR